MLLLMCACTPAEKPAKEEPFGGATRTFDLTVDEGSYDLLMYNGMSMGRLDGYLINGQFLGPALVMDEGDTAEVTLHNATDKYVGLHPHGVHYEQDSEGMMQDSLAAPGGDYTYTWKATDGSGTFLYHSHQLDSEMREYQAEAGVLGVIVIRGPDDPPYDYMLDYVMMNTYEAWTEIDPCAMGCDTGDTAAATEDEEEEHTHTLVVQEVRDGVTDTQEDLRVSAKLGDEVRVNVVAFGEEFHTFHTHGYTWKDPYTGQLLDTRSLGPAESFLFPLELDNPGEWMIHCHVDSHIHMMSSWLDVEE